MNILTELVGLLTENEAPITNALLKIKVLASRLNNIPLYEWVSKELSGYEHFDVLPKYRKYGCLFVGNYLNGNMKGTNQSLPVANLPDVLKGKLENIEFYQGISVLESFLKSNEPIKVAIAPEIINIVNRIYKDWGNSSLHIYSGYQLVGSGTVEQTISDVRNSALDLILKLEGEFGYEIKLEDLIRKKNEVNQTIYHTMNHIINTTGNGNLINTGDNAKNTNRVNIEKNNFESLRSLLNENQVAPSDISELEQIIDEQPDIERKLFGPKINSWLQKMLTKSMDGSWQVGIGTAGNLLSEAIKGFYGM